MSDLLSICIPTYNRPDEVLRQLEYLRLEIENTEVAIVVSDNNSSTPSREELANYHKRNPFFELHNQTKNLGLIGNVEFLLSVCKSRYVWFIGDDDNLKEGAIEKVIYNLKNRLEISYLYINHLSYRGDKANVIGSYDVSQFSGLNKLGEEFFRQMFINYGTILMFMSSNIYRTDTLSDLKSRINRSLVLEDFLTFSFYSAISGKTVVLDEVLVYNNCTTISWYSKGRALFAINIPLRIIEFMEVLRSRDYTDLLRTHYRQGRGSLVYMLLYARAADRKKILMFLNWVDIFVTLTNEFVTLPIRVLRRFLISSRIM